jgi:hypothetical protein
MSENTLTMLLIATVGVWTIIETRIEVKFGINRSAGRLILGLGCAAIFLFYGWLYNFYNHAPI